MRASLRSLQTIEGNDLVGGYVPSDPTCFSLVVRMLVGPTMEVGEEFFDITLCVGRHLLIVDAFDYGQLKAFLEKYVSRFDEKSWDDLAR
jgi:hypothetical protein